VAGYLKGRQTSRGKQDAPDSQYSFKTYVVKKNVIRDFREFFREALKFVSALIFDGKDLTQKLLRERPKYEALIGKVVELLQVDIQFESLGEREKASMVSLFNINRAAQMYTFAVLPVLGSRG
jgi:hypothetical protein